MCRRGLAGLSGIVVSEPDEARLLVERVRSAGEGLSGGQRLAAVLYMVARYGVSVGFVGDVRDL